MFRPPAFVVALAPTSGAPIYGVPLATCVLLLAACSSPGDPPPADVSDPALVALVECVETRPDRVCPRPSVATEAGETLVDAVYWERARTASPEVFLDAVGLCGRAAAADAHVGSDAGVAAVRAAFAQEHGRAAADDEVELGVCHDVLLTLGHALGDGAPDLGDRLTEEEALWVAGRARAKVRRAGARERAAARRARYGDVVPSSP